MKECFKGVDSGLSHNSVYETKKKKTPSVMCLKGQTERAKFHVDTVCSVSFDR